MLLSFRYIFSDDGVKIVFFCSSFCFVDFVRFMLFRVRFVHRDSNNCIILKIRIMKVKINPFRPGFNYAMFYFIAKLIW